MIEPFIGFLRPWAFLTNHQLGELARRRDDTSQAEDLHHEALTLRARAGLRPGMAWLRWPPTRKAAWRQPGCLGLPAHCEPRLAWPAGRRSRPPTTPMWPGSETPSASMLFHTAWAEGEALTLDEAVAYVSRARGERKRPSSGWASLTPTEAEVVRHVTAGLTNRQIGERMFISAGTVKIHLSHIFAKLGILSRSQLAAEATRRGRD
jgi:DNA-binding CsgD family transcriptional regulator